MQLDYANLAALAAVLRSGSFHGGAEALGVTPSAISQRIKQLEERFGAILILRGKPCTPTAMGNRLLRHIEALELMEVALASDLDLDTPGVGTIRVGVNADSLATWLIDALSQLPDTVFELVICDQDYSDELLRAGEVSIAITGTAEPVQGCDVFPLGQMIYAATAAPSYMARYFPDGVTPEALQRAPPLRFSDRDQLQRQWALQHFGSERLGPSHLIPTTNGFVDACCAGMGWGLNVASMVEQALASGDLVELIPDSRLISPLYWQVMRNQKAAMAPLTDRVLVEARKQLAPMPAASD